MKKLFTRKIFTRRIVPRPPSLLSPQYTRRSLTYAYDDNGNLRSEQRTGVDIDKRDEAVSYTYDNGNRLVSMTLNSKTTKYTYDKAGNLTNDGTTTYTYGQQNRLLSKTGTDGTTTYTYDAAGNLTKETTPDGTVDYTYNAQNRLTLGERSDGQSSEYVYNAMGARVENTQVRENKNAAYQSGDLIDGSHGTDYKDFLSDNRATWQRTWETEVGTTVQNDYETVTQHYIVDYLSVANRDIMVTEDGSWTQRYVYDQSGTRISAEYTHADGTARGTVNADGDYGENFQSDTAVDEVQKVWFRTSPLGSTLFAIDADGETVSHTIYDPWGKPLTETYVDANFSGLDNVNSFTGYTWDEVLGLYYAQARLYNVDTHRFTQQDPAKDDRNWYVYCGDNPLTRTDPWGQRYTSPSGAIIADDGSGYVKLSSVVTCYNNISGSKTRNEYTIKMEGRSYSFDLAMGQGATMDMGHSVIVPYYAKSGEIYVEYSSFNTAISWHLGVGQMMRYISDTPAATPPTSTPATPPPSTAPNSDSQSNILTQDDIKAGISTIRVNGTVYKDVTVPLNAALSKTVAIAEYFAQQTAAAYTFWGVLCGKYAGALAATHLWFYSVVKSGAMWDIKLQNKWNETIAPNTYPGFGVKVYYNGWLMTVEQLGNYTLGYIGHAAGFPLNELYAGSFAVSDPTSGARFNDEVYNDWPIIERGFNAYKK